MKVLGNHEIAGIQEKATIPEYSCKYKLISSTANAFFLRCPGTFAADFGGCRSRKLKFRYKMLPLTSPFVCNSSDAVVVMSLCGLMISAIISCPAPTADATVVAEGKLQNKMWTAGKCGEK